MSKFERIVREPLVMGGQARIRDTGITVNEIVRLSLAGSSQAEILQKFPQLEAEDVHEALGWHVWNSNRIYSDCLNEMRAPMASLLGYAELLNFNESAMNSLAPEAKRKMIKTLALRSEQVSSTLYLLLDGLKIGQLLGKAFEAKGIAWQSIESELISEVISDVFVLAKTSPTEILNLLCRGELTFYEKPNACKIVIEKSVKQLHFRVIRQGKLDMRVFDYPTVLSTANLLIFDSGSELKIRQEEDTVIFEFALPIVEAE